MDNNYHPENGFSTIQSPYCTVPEAAEFLRLNPRTLNNMRCAGRGPSFHKHGRKVLYHIDELIRWSNATKQDMTEQPEDMFSVYG